MSNYKCTLRCIYRFYIKIIEINIKRSLIDNNLTKKDFNLTTTGMLNMLLHFGLIGVSSHTRTLNLIKKSNYMWSNIE